jgi:hypothetical protein
VVRFRRVRNVFSLIGVCHVTGVGCLKGGRGIRAMRRNALRRNALHLTAAFISWTHDRYDRNLRNVALHRFLGDGHANMPSFTSTPSLTPNPASERESSRQLELLTFVIGIPAAILSLVTILRLLFIWCRATKGKTSLLPILILPWTMTDTS